MEKWLKCESGRLWRLTAKRSRLVVMESIATTYRGVLATHQRLRSDRRYFVRNDWVEKKKKKTLYTRKSDFNPPAALQILSQIVGSPLPNLWAFSSGFSCGLLSAPHHAGGIMQCVETETEESKQAIKRPRSPPNKWGPQEVMLWPAALAWLCASQLIWWNAKGINMCRCIYRFGVRWSYLVSHQLLHAESCTFAQPVIFVENYILYLKY